MSSWLDGRPAGLQGPDRQLRRAHGQEDGAGLVAARPFHVQRRDRGRPRPASSRPTLGPDDVAFLQYTGGTTGVAKGATLLHRNIVANLLQLRGLDAAGAAQKRRARQLTIVCALPLYHIFALTACGLLGMRTGGAQHPHSQSARHAGLRQGTGKVPDQHLPGREHAVQRAAQQPGLRQARLLRAGALQRRRHGGAGGGRRELAGHHRLPDRRRLRPVRDLARRYLQPRRLEAFTGTIGLPLPSTEITIRDDDGKELPLGEAGEICIRGPAGHGRLLAAAGRDGQGHDARTASSSPATSA